MTTTRRITVLIGLTVGASLPASAAFVDLSSYTVDADNLAYQPRLSVTTLTGYGWTAQSALTGYVTC